MDTLKEVMTFAEATELLGRNVNYLADMVRAGKLIEGYHFRTAGRVKLILRSVVEKIKENGGINMKDTIYQIYEVITSTSNQQSNRFIEAYNDIMDKIEDGEVEREDVEVYKRAALEASKYNGYTNIQHETLSKVDELIELL